MEYDIIKQTIKLTIDQIEKLNNLLVDPDIMRFGEMTFDQQFGIRVSALYAESQQVERFVAEVIDPRKWVYVRLQCSV